MSILSRFRRQKKEDTAPEELDETLANSEEEGMLMSTGAGQASPGEEAKPAAGTPVDNDAASEAEIDDLLEAAESGATPPTIGDTVAEKSDAPAASESGVDDLLEAAEGGEAATEGAGTAPVAEDAAASEADVDDLLEAAEGEEATAEGAGAAPVAEDAAASEAGGDDLLEAAEGREAAEGGEAAAEQESAAEASPLYAGTPAEEESTEETSDDPLAAFGEVVVESEVADLANELEDVSVEELVELLREVRAMLPQIDENQEAA